MFISSRGKEVEGNDFAQNICLYELTILTNVKKSDELSLNFCQSSTTREQELTFEKN